MYRFENYLFICVFYKISEYIEEFQIIFFLPHLKFVKNIAIFYLYLLLFIFLEDYFAISFIIFSTSEISISSISAICSIENLLANFLVKLHSINWNQQLPVATIYCRWFPDTADSFSEDYVYSLFGPPLHISHHLHLRHRHLIESVGCVSWYVPSLLDRGHIDFNSIHNFWS